MASAAELQGIYDFTHAGGTFDVHLRPGMFPYVVVYACTTLTRSSPPPLHALIMCYVRTCYIRTRRARARAHALTHALTHALAHTHTHARTDSTTGGRFFAPQFQAAATWNMLEENKLYIDWVWEARTRARTHTHARTHRLSPLLSLTHSRAHARAHTHTQGGYGQYELTMTSSSPPALEVCISMSLSHRYPLALSHAYLENRRRSFTSYMHECLYANRYASRNAYWYVCPYVQMYMCVRARASMCVYSHT